MEIYPVVHILGSGEAAEVAYEQVETARRLGAAGVFLIDHGACKTPGRLASVYNELREQDKEVWIGVNFLGQTTIQALRLLEEVGARPDGLWVDDVRKSGVSVGMGAARDYAQNLGVPVFGGVAFKYTGLATNNPESAAKQARRYGKYCDVITTSGLGTGIPPTVEKLKAMKEAADGRPIAVASGIDEENIRDFKGSVDKVLVASSVETRPGSGVLDERKLERIVKLGADLRED